MEKNYFNKYEFKKAVDHGNVNPFTAINMFQNYIQKYPDDYNSYCYYANLLILIGKVDEAESVLDKMLKLKEENTKYQNLDRRNYYLTNDILWVKLRLLVYQNKYQELYQFITDNYKRIFNNTDFHVYKTILFCKKHLGILSKDDLMSVDYSQQQIVNYSEANLLNHLLRHDADYNRDNDKDNEAIFMSDIDISDLINKVKPYLLNASRLYMGFIDDTYIFKYDACGKDGNKTVDFFKVVCLHDTTDILTMYPEDGLNYFPYIDINHLRDSNNIKVKKRSQIDKFNQRYNKK